MVKMTKLPKFTCVILVISLALSVFRLDGTDVLPCSLKDYHQPGKGPVKCSVICDPSKTTKLRGLKFCDVNCPSYRVSCVQQQTMPESTQLSDREDRNRTLNSSTHPNIIYYSMNTSANFSFYDSSNLSQVVSDGFQPWMAGPIAFGGALLLVALALVCLKKYKLANYRIIKKKPLHFPVEESYREGELTPEDLLSLEAMLIARSAGILMRELPLRHDMRLV